VPPDAYGQLLAAVHAAIGGRAKLVTGGLLYSDNDSPPLGDLTAWLDAVPGLADNADAIGIHPYGVWYNNTLDDAPLERQGQRPLSEVIDALAGYGMPLWITEWNIADANITKDADGNSSDAALEANKAQMFIDFFTSASADWRIDHAYFFGWSDALESGFGLVDSEDHEKPYVQDFRAALAQQTSQRSRPLGGTVVDDNGAVTGDVTIYATRLAPTRTNPDDGSFTLPNLDGGRGYVLVAVDGSGAHGVGMTTVVGGLDPVNVLVHMPIEAGAADGSTGSVSGVVRASDGKPLDGGAVLFAYCGSKRARLASDGSFRIDGVPGGVHQLAIANLAGAQRYQPAVWPIAVSPGQTLSLPDGMLQVSATN
jgi:hypothetical protein